MKKGTMTDRAAKLADLIDAATTAEPAGTETKLDVEEGDWELIVRALRAFSAEMTMDPAGYAVIMADGPFVGIWRDRTIAEKIQAKQPSSHGDRVVPLYDSAIVEKLWNLVDRADKMMAMAGYAIAEHNPDHNNPVIAWRSDARIPLARKPDQ